MQDQNDSTEGDKICCSNGDLTAEDTTAEDSTAESSTAEDLTAGSLTAGSLTAGSLTAGNLTISIGNDNDDSSSMSSNSTMEYDLQASINGKRDISISTLHSTLNWKTPGMQFAELGTCSIFLFVQF